MENLKELRLGIMAQKTRQVIAMKRKMSDNKRKRERFRFVYS